MSDTRTGMSPMANLGQGEPNLGQGEQKPSAQNRPTEKGKTGEHYVSPVVDKIAGQVNEMSGPAREAGTQAMKTIADQVRAEPVIGILAAAAVGYLIGAYYRR